MVFYDSAAFIERGDESARFHGNGPCIVPGDGQLDQLGSALSPDEEIATLKRSTVFAPDPWPRPGLTAFFPAPSGVFAGSPYPRDCGIESVIQPFVIGPLDQLEVGIVPLAPRSIFTVPLGFGCTAIPAGEEVTFACTVASPTQIIRWVIPSSVAFQLLVTEMTVGRDRILVCEPVPAAIFVEDAAVPEIMNDSIANGGQTISITLKNITPVAIEVVCVGAIARVLSS